MFESGDRIVVAMPVHQGRISPLFDTARRLLVAELAGGGERSRYEIDLSVRGVGEHIEAILASGAGLLICGAISNAGLWQMSRRGLPVWPGVVGDVDDVITTLASTGTLTEAFTMPGVARSGPLRDGPFLPGPDTEGAAPPGSIEAGTSARVPPGKRESGKQVM